MLKPLSLSNPAFWVQSNSVFNELVWVRMPGRLWCLWTTFSLEVKYPYLYPSPVFGSVSKCTRYTRYTRYMPCHAEATAEADFMGPHWSWLFSHGTLKGLISTWEHVLNLENKGELASTSRSEGIRQPTYQHTDSCRNFLQVLQE